MFRQLFDPESSTYTYLLADPETKRALLIDPVRDQIERDTKLLEELGLTLTYTLETHVHADHIAGSGMLRKQLGSRSHMSERAGAACADVMLKDGQLIELDGIQIEARLTPGHTNGCVSYVDHRGGRVFTGDTLLIRGCGRTDFQQGSSDDLYASVHDKLFTLPDHYMVYPGHDYRGRTVSTIGEEKQHNPRLGAGKTREEFVEIMANLKLSQPKKIAIAVPREPGVRVAHAACERATARAWLGADRTRRRRARGERRLGEGTRRRRDRHRCPRAQRARGPARSISRGAARTHRSVGAGVRRLEPRCALRGSLQVRRSQRPRRDRHGEGRIQARGVDAGWDERVARRRGERTGHLRLR